ncbi:MAG: phytanoyl-CoA dioxygenase family protein [Candidatus Poribacteria bacterium]|nr:phytanoyl-CoA dioxygenase family protein [Candidatus Poribacteria bacterium]
MLTAEQKSYFDTFGFLLMRQYFPPDEIATITREFDKVMTEDRGGKPFAGVEQGVVTIVEQSALLTQMVEDDRIYKVIEELAGQGFIWSGSEGNLTAHSEHRWHADRPGVAEVDYMRVKIMIYLDPVTKERGCLRVIPGSHRLPLHTDLQPLIAQKEDSCQKTFGVAGADLPCFPLEAQPGDVVFFNHCLWHGMFGGWAGRRYIALKFAALPTTGAHMASLQRWSPYALKPDAAFVNSDRPRIRGMMENIPGFESKG